MAFSYWTYETIVAGAWCGDDLVRAWSALVLPALTWGGNG